jgi:3-dehydroquinate synthase
VHQNIQFNLPDQIAESVAPWNEWLETGRLRILADDRFRTAPVFGPLLPFWDQIPKCFIPGGEASKSLDVVQKIWSWLDAEATDRGHVLVIVGGGTITDLGGFVASTYKRGLPFVLIPTTIMGMIDAAIGGKNGINYAHFKNQIGLFQLPALTYIDDHFISSLDALERTNGWMELVKHSLIADAALWNDIADIDIHLPDAIEPWIQPAARIKKTIVAQDFLDQSVRKTLNYGHTLAHALEWKAQEDGIPLSHGVAVGWGMIWSNGWSGSLQPTESRSLFQVSQKIHGWLDGIPENNQRDWLSALNPRDVWPAILRDKKNRNGVVLDVVLDRVGNARWDQPLTLDKFSSIWKQVFQ